MSNKKKKDKESELIQQETINVIGAREHNLKNISVTIPRDKLTVITGLSGSGKSSLAFDTIYTEGQRRYIETFSAYARSFLGNVERPDVDEISGLSPVISIEQKTTNKNPRSTVGTVTEIYDFLRLLYARAGQAISYETQEPMVRYTEDQILSLIESEFDGKGIYILAPVVKNRKGHYRELFDQIIKKGFLQVRVDGDVQEVRQDMRVDRYKNHNIEIVIDKLKIREGIRQRLTESVRLAMKHGGGVLMILAKGDTDARFFSKFLMCPTTGIAYKEPAPHNFSFNSPQGACPACNGLGRIDKIDDDLMIPDYSLSIYKGGLVPLGKYKNTLIFWQIEALLEKYKCDLKTPLSEIPKECIQSILYGTTERLQLRNTPLGGSLTQVVSYEGVVKYIKMQSESSSSQKARKWAEQFIKQTTCDECHGQRLKRESLHFVIDGKNIAELSLMELDDLSFFLSKIEDRLDDRQKLIATEILKEMRDRIRFLQAVGLGYLSLNRGSATLSGGESQRIRLATQIGSELVNVLYILDEPSIGLHQRDNERLITSLKQLRDNSNSIIVVEHDRDIMLESDYIIDLGPHAGRLGGEVVSEGTPQEMLKSHTLTAQYLNGEKAIEIPAERREGNGNYIELKGVTGNNLKNIDVKFPLGTFICVSGVSGSGKSTLINETLQPILSQHFYKSVKDPMPYKKMTGIEHIDKVIRVDQTPLGRTPRSNPATYTGVFSDIRNLFTQLPEAKIRGYKPGRFSFNVKGGRCEECQGNGMKVIEMNFLPDVYVHCDKCHGKRYNRETLEVRYKGKSIGDVLDMTINQATEFFESFPSILKKLKTLKDVGLGYITLGQSSTTLSGGESQRVKLATELSKKDTGKTLFILDEPTTGLHFEDINILLGVLQSLVNKGNTVIVIEHNLDVIKVADYIVDIGPEGGKGGGELLAEGTPEEVAKNKISHTARFLKRELARDSR